MFWISVSNGLTQNRNKTTDKSSTNLISETCRWFASQNYANRAFSTIKQGGQ
jgi:hypothetical protein